MFSWCEWSIKLVFDSAHVKCDVYQAYDVKFRFTTHFFFVTGVRVKFRFGIISSDRVRSTTVNSLLRALRAISNISSDDGEDFFADELLVY